MEDKYNVFDDMKGGLFGTCWVTKGVPDSTISDGEQGG